MDELIKAFARVTRKRFLPSPLQHEVNVYDQDEVNVSGVLALSIVFLRSLTLLTQRFNALAPWFEKRTPSSRPREALQEHESTLASFGYPEGSFK